MKEETPFLNLEKRVTCADTEAIHDFLKSIGIEHLDNITNDHIKKYRNLWRSINVKKTGKYLFLVNDVKQRLVELRLFDPKVCAYNEKIRKEIIEEVLNPHGTTFKSYYVNEELEENVLKENIKIAFDEFKRRGKIEHLDDITRKLNSGYKSFWNSIGIKKIGKYPPVNDVKNRLVELGLLSPKIVDYDEKIREKIIKNALNSPRFSSYYINRILNKNWHDNLKIVFNALKKREELKHLDSITYDIAKRYFGFWNCIGVDKNGNWFNIDDIKSRLVELGLFSDRIASYDKESRNDIIKSALNPLSAFKSYFLNGHLDNNVRYDNIKISFESLKRAEKIENLNDITSEFAHKYYGFFTTIGVKKTGKVLSVNNVKARLIQLGFFKKDAENKYGCIKLEGNATDLLKKLDSELFGYKDARFDENKVDNASYLVLKKIHGEAKRRNIKLNNSLDLLKYYKREYENVK